MRKAWFIVGALVILIEGGWWAYTTHYAPPTGSGIRKVDATWPKDKREIDLVNSTDPRARLWLIIDFALDGIHTGSRVYGLSPRKEPGYWGSSSTGIGCGFNGSTSESVILDGYDFDGFEVALNISWDQQDKGKGEIERTFKCQWKKEQTFEADGLRLRVSILPAPPLPNTALASK